MAEEAADRVEALFHQTADLPPEEQQALLDRVCADDPALRAVLERLLADDARLRGDEDSPFLDSPLVRAAPFPTRVAPPANGPQLPTRVGPYRILRLLGEGGMGAVYEAEQDNPRRAIALKVIRPGLITPSLCKRFIQEAQILGRLHHPGIATIHEAGVADGQPFLALELIRGVPLDEYVRRHSLPPAARLELLARVCDSVHYANDHGVIHRDLKPSNILVDETGQSKVLDFGVARVLDDDWLTRTSRTQTGQLIGTLAYMSPEQIAADPAGLDRRSDVYTLGVILFELLAGQLPYSVEQLPLTEVMQIIRTREPSRLSSIDARCRGDRDTIVAKCLEKDRGRRYPSAAELAADIRRHLRNEPIRARPSSAIYRLAKFVRRNKVLVGGVAGVICALVVGLIGTLIFAFREAEQRRLAENNARRANDEKQVAQYQAYRACLAAASPALHNHDVVDAARHLDAAPDALRGWEWRHLRSQLDDSSAVVPLPAGRGFLLTAPDQLRVGVLTSAGLRITDLDGREHGIVPLGPERRLRVDVAQTRRGLRIAAWSENAGFELLDEAGKVVCRVTMPEKNLEPAHVEVSPDGTRLACRIDGDCNWVAVFDGTSGKQVATCKGHGDAIRTLAFSPDSAQLATGSEDRTARLWDAANGTLLATCKGHRSIVRSVAFSPDGVRLLTASADRTVRQWNARTGQEIELPYDRHSKALFSAVYSPDGQWVASTGEDRTVRVWRAGDRHDAAVLHGHTGCVVDVAFATEASRLPNLSAGSTGSLRLASLSTLRVGATAGDDTVRVWDVDPRAPLPVLRGHTGTINPIAYSPDGRWLASGSWDKTVRLWDAATGEPCATLPHPSVVAGLGFGPDGTWLVTGCFQDDRLRIWDVATARVRKEIPLSIKNICSLTVSSDGARVAATAEVTNQKWRLTVCDIASGKEFFSTEGWSLTYSPDGRWLAALAADEKTVLLLDARTLETAARFSGHEKTVFKAAFSPDSRCLATCSRDRTVRLWQIDSGACQVLQGHTDEVYAVAFHPDGTRLATAARDGVVWLWDLARGEEVARLPGHRGFVWSLAYSPEGATLASGSGDSTVRLWDTVPLKRRYQARREATALRPEAERLVEQLWREKKDPAVVVGALRADQTLDAALRHAALRAVMRWAQQPEAVPGHPLDLP